MIYSILESEEIWIRFKKLGKLARKYQAEAKVLIPILARSGVYKRHGYDSIHEAALILAGISYETTRKVLSTHARAAKFPRIQKMIPKVGYNKVSVVLPVTNKRNQLKIMDMLETLPLKVLKAKVKEMKIDLGYESHNEEEKDIVLTIRISSKNREKFNVAKYKLEKKLKRKVNNEEVFYAFFSEETEVIESNNIEKDFTRNKTLTPKQKEYIKSKNRYICQAEGCLKVATEIHHGSYRSLNPNKHDNLQAFCRVHHQLVHYEIQNKSLAQKRIDAKVQSYWRKE